MSGHTLKPCPNPWCDAADRDGDYSPTVINSNFGTHYVSCTSCSMRGPYERNHVNAIAAWNERPIERELLEALEEIAAFNDRAANAYLKQTGSYSLFDEPGSVQIARAAIAKAQVQP